MRRRWQALAIKEATDQIAEAMEKAGIDKARIFAFRKTGLMPTESNLHLLTEQDKRDWNDALAEFDRMQEK